MRTSLVLSGIVQAALCAFSAAPSIAQAETATPSAIVANVNIATAKTVGSTSPKAPMVEDALMRFRRASPTRVIPRRSARRSRPTTASRRRTRIRSAIRTSTSWTTVSAIERRVATCSTCSRRSWSKVRSSLPPGVDRQRTLMACRRASRNGSGSGTTSLGLYVTQGTYAFSGHSGGSLYSSIGLRLNGVSGQFNDQALARGVVVHGAPYVTTSGSGRSLGCPAMEQDRAHRLIPKIANGGLVFLFSPNDSQWMHNDPWAA